MHPLGAPCSIYRDDMYAEIRTLEKIFSGPVQLLIPLYQRPYVWEQGKQWEPLWEDVRSVAERLCDHLAMGVPPKRAQTLVTRHFMGAVVLQQIHTAIGEMDRFAVIDGQQRLTTLQIMIDAAQAVLFKAADAGTDLLSSMVENTLRVRTEGDRLKILPTNVDRAPFREVMEAAPDINYASLEHANARIVEAHRFFSSAVNAWMDEAPDENDRKYRAESLTTVLLGMLTVVVIELEKDENAQLIFETLNARNTPLLASDLVKNVLFQRIEEGSPGTSEALYEKNWRFLDAENWRKTVRQGRLVRPRLDLFLYYWLIMHKRESVMSHEVFSTVREMLENESATTLLTAISANAKQFEKFETEKDATVLGTFRYRLIDVMQSDAITPVLLWLHDPTKPAVPQKQIDLALGSLESWAVRRMLCRLTTKDYNKVFLDLLEQLGKLDPAEVGNATRAFLAGQTAESRIWPSDGKVSDALASTELYRVLSRARLRMVLEAIEDKLRTEYSEQRIDRGKYTIEHILPQAWKTHWPLENHDESIARNRNRLLHTIGNLTLVTRRLNPKLSNGAWDNKKQALASHSVLRLNHELLATADSAWDESGILARSERLTKRVLAVWPRPE